MEGEDRSSRAGAACGGLGGRGMQTPYRRACPDLNARPACRLCVRCRQLGGMTRAALLLLRLGAAGEVFRMGWLVGSYKQVGDTGLSHAAAPSAGAGGLHGFCLVPCRCPLLAWLALGRPLAPSVPVLTRQGMDCTRRLVSLRSPLGGEIAEIIRARVGAGGWQAACWQPGVWWRLGCVHAGAGML